MNEKKKKASGLFCNIRLAIKKNAEITGMNPIRYIIIRTVKTLSYTIPGFIIVLMFPIKAEASYGWFSGIWQGWFGLCNIVIRQFSPDTLFIAPNSSLVYYLMWWLWFFEATYLLLFIIILPFINVFEKQGFQFVFSPNDSPEIEQSLSQKDGVKTNLKQRIVKIFISSTFQDMQKERDYLMRHTFPELQRIAASRGVKIIPVDLRWGITEEESKSGKVLELCLQEIDNANPFFIGIIGKRYGWCPSQEEIEKSTLLKEKYPWIENDFRNNLSVTDIEFQYGVLRRKERINAAFFSTGGNFILPKSYKSEHGKAIHLKTVILKDGRYPLIDVSGRPETFGNEVYKMYVAFLNQFYPVTDSSDTSTEQKDNDLSMPTRQYIEEYLLRYSKKLSDSQMDMILNFPLSQNRIVLKSLLDELIVFGNYEKLDEYIEFLLQSQTPSQFYQLLLQSYEKQYGKRSVKSFFSIMRLTDYGLKVKDALQIADVGVKASDAVDFMDMLMSPIKFIRDFFSSITNVQLLPFDQYFQAYLKRRGDVISLNHQWMEQAVDERYLTDQGVVRKYRKKILDMVVPYAKTHETSPENNGRIEEIVYQMIELGKVSDLNFYVKNADNYVVCSYLTKYRPELYERMLKYLNHQ